MLRKICTFCLLLFLSTGLAVCAQEKPSSEFLAQKSVEIAKELRCPSSTNQSLYESESAIAAELKAKIYQMLENGQSKEEIFSYFAQRYGEQIRYQPEMTGSTMWLWIVPIFLIGAILVWALLFILKQKANRTNS